MTAKINITELLADREVGTDDYAMHKCSCGHPSCDQYTFAGMGSAGVYGPDARRIARLPALEAAYIEAVGLLAEVREHLADGNIGKAIVRIDRGPLVGDAQ